MRLLKTVLATIAVLGAFAGTSVVAFAYPEPGGHEEIHCQPGDVSSNNGHCTVIFKDKDKNDNPVAGQQICFTVQGPGTVQPSCNTTDGKGEAAAIYQAGNAACGNADKDGHASATITGKETAPETVGEASTTVQIKCPKPGGGGGGGQACHDHCTGDNNTACHDHCDGSNNTACHDHCNGDGNTACHDHCSSLTSGDQETGCHDHCYQTSDQANASAHLNLNPTAGTGGGTGGGAAMLGLGILGVIVVLSVAITGRLRLRRLRR